MNVRQKEVDQYVDLAVGVSSEVLSMLCCLVGREGRMDLL